MLVQEDVERLQGSLHIEHTLAKVGAEKLWKLMHEEPYVPALGALTGNQAMQMVRAGLKAIYCSGWQVGSYSSLTTHQRTNPLCIALAQDMAW
jgi:isocitrate lyase